MWLEFTWSGVASENVRFEALHDTMVLWTGEHRVKEVEMPMPRDLAVPQHQPLPRGSYWRSCNRLCLGNSYSLKLEASTLS